MWFAEYAGNAIDMFDPTSERMKEYPLSVPWSNPYDVVPSKGGAEPKRRAESFVAAA